LSGSAPPPLKLLPLVAAVAVLLTDGSGATEEATDLLEDTYTTAMKGSVDYNLKLIDAARANANATFDFVSELIGVKSLSEVVELSTAHARKQFEAFTQQAKDLTAAAQKLATDTSEPLKTGVSKAFKKVA